MFNPHAEAYNAVISADDISADDNTDQHVVVRDLKPIEDCLLTPGHPSPVGRTADGDLAYVLRKTTTWLPISRRNCAELLHLLAQKHGVTKLGDPVPDEIAHLMGDLMVEAVPRLLFGDSMHENMAYRAACNAALRGDWDNFPDFLDSTKTK